MKCLRKTSGVYVGDNLMFDGKILKTSTGKIYDEDVNLTLIGNNHHIAAEWFDGKFVLSGVSKVGTTTLHFKNNVIHREDGLAVTGCDYISDRRICATFNDFTRGTANVENGYYLNGKCVSKEIVLSKSTFSGALAICINEMFGIQLVEGMCEVWRMLQRMLQRM